MPNGNNEPSFKSEPVLVWGIAGASLGMEIAKCLQKADFKAIIGCDISNIAFGHFSEVFKHTFTLDQNNLESSLARVLEQSRPRFVIAGGDVVARLLHSFKQLFDSYGCRICGNSPTVAEVASDKYEVIVKLQAAGFSVPKTELFNSQCDLASIVLPCVLKPRFDSGGSRGVHVVKTKSDLERYARNIFESGVPYIVQDYIDARGGEFTIGVLSDSLGRVAGAIPLRRTFQNMLSVHERGQDYLISSGSSQGHFDRNESVQRTAEAMAIALGSCGPLNIQARLLDGVLLPFEVNPRFSASTYLRALSGVNEVSLMIEHLVTGNPIDYPSWKEGMALRTFGELFVDKERVPTSVL